MTTEHQLTTTDAPPSTAQLIATVLQSGSPKENIEVLERLCALKEREEERAAERDFNIAFARVQTETPKIVASKAVPDKHGNVKYSYAPYEEIMRKVQPLLATNGFAVSFDTDFKDGRVHVICTLSHISGHSRSNKFSCRPGGGPPGASEAQGDGAATTYAKRFALCGALNIVIEQDSDGRDGDAEQAITKEQAADLRLRCENMVPPIDMAKFCRWLGVNGFDEIPASKYAMADAKLKEREAKARA